MKSDPREMLPTPLLPPGQTQPLSWNPRSGPARPPHYLPPQLTLGTPLPVICSLEAKRIAPTTPTSTKGGPQTASGSAPPLTWVQLQAVFGLQALPGDGDQELSQEFAVLGERGRAGMREGSRDTGREAPALVSPVATPPTCILR